MGFAFIEDVTGRVVHFQRWGVNGSPPEPPPGHTVVVADSLEAAEPASQALEDAKAAKIEEIDAKTRSLFAVGVQFKGKVVSLSLAAQSNLSGLLTIYGAGALRFPQGVSAIDGDEVIIEDATELQQLTAIAFGRIKQITDTGRVLRKQVLAATTTDEVGLVTDVRE